MSILYIKNLMTKILFVLKIRDTIKTKKKFKNMKLVFVFVVLQLHVKKNYF